MSLLCWQICCLKWQPNFIKNQTNSSFLSSFSYSTNSKAKTNCPSLFFDFVPDVHRISHTKNFGWFLLPYSSLFYLKIRSRNQISFFLVLIYSFCCVLCVTQACAFMKFMFCTIYPKDVHLVKFPIVKCLESLSSIYENLYKHTHLSCMSHFFHLTVGITTGKSYWLPTSPCEISPIFKKVPHYFKNWAYTFQN